jgi:hypothetical protein
MNVIAGAPVDAVGSARVHLDPAKVHCLTHLMKGDDWMERRYVFTLAIGIAAGAAGLAATANSAPLAPASAVQLAAPRGQVVEPAVVSQTEVDHLQPQEVRWGRHWHRHWRWHRHWHHRHWR